MDNWPGWTTRFELMYRQEQSVHASGRVRVKDFGTPIWRAGYQSKLLRPNQVDEWRARLAALENGLLTYQAWPMSRCWPINYPNGSSIPPSDWVLDDDTWGPGGLWLTGLPWVLSLPTTTTVASTADGNKVTLTTPLDLTIGDYLQIGARLHQIVAASGGIYTVAPHLSVGVLNGDTVTLYRPSVAMALVPGSVQSTTSLNGRAVLSFEAMEARG